MLKYTCLCLLLLAACRSKITQPTVEIVSSDGLKETRDTVENEDLAAGIAAIAKHLADLKATQQQGTDGTNRQNNDEVLKTLTELVAKLETNSDGEEHQAEIDELKEQLAELKAAADEQTGDSEGTQGTDTGGGSQGGGGTQDDGTTTEPNKPELVAGTYLYLDPKEGARVVEGKKSYTAKLWLDVDTTKPLVLKGYGEKQQGKLPAGAIFIAYDAHDGTSSVYENHIFTQILKLKNQASTTTSDSKIVLNSNMAINLNSDASAGDE